MLLLFRPILASLLCGVIVLGHAPAWLHVGTCQGHGTAAVVVDAEQPVTVCSHGCQHQASSQLADETQHAGETSDLPTPGDRHHHDSDTCSICQSLASPTGVDWELLVRLPSEFVSEPVLVAAEPVFAATLLCIPPPRGPPALV